MILPVLLWRYVSTLAFIDLPKPIIIREPISHQYHIQTQYVHKAGPGETGKDILWKGNKEIALPPGPCISLVGTGLAPDLFDTNMHDPAIDVTLISGREMGDSRGRVAGRLFRV